MKHPMKVMITGGAGFIGSHVCDQLLAAGHQVTVYDRKPVTVASNISHVHQYPNFSYIQGDICDAEALEWVIPGHTHVLHLAAVVSVQESIAEPHQTFATNVEGTFNVFEAARRHRVTRVVYASSAAVYGDPVTVPVHECATIQPVSPYGMHKLDNEYWATWFSRVAGLSTVGLRFFNVYGPRQDPTSPYSGVISIFLDRMMHGVPPTIYGDGTATRDFVYVADVAAACQSLLTASSPQPIYNVGTGAATTIGAVIAELNTLLDTALTPTFAAARPGDIVHSCADIARLQRTLMQWQPLSLAAGLSHCLKEEVLICAE